MQSLVHKMNRKEDAMKEFKTGCATVKIHGNPNREKVEAATIKFLKATERKRRNEKNTDKNT